MAKHEHHADHWIGGKWVNGADTAATVDPATGAVVGSYALGSADLAGEAVAAARRAFEHTSWAAKPRLRAGVLLHFADAIARRKGELVEALVRENGKLKAEAAHEVDAAVSEARYYAGLARAIFGRVTEIDEGVTSVFAREPIGVAAVIVPWNAPVTLLVRSLAPAMAAGCASVVKPAPQTSNVNRIMMQCLAEIDELPAGIVNSVNENGICVGQALVASPDVDTISFTGASRTGKAIMAAAAGTLKRLSLELGGKAPTLVFADADVDVALPVITRGATVLAGQMCTAITRTLVHESRYTEVAEKLAARLAAIKVGPGAEPSSQMGPVIDRAARDRLAECVSVAGQEGELILRGAAVEEGPLAAGNFITPSLVAIDNPASHTVQEELFGPILTLERFGEEAEAVRKANATRYGLAASVWTGDAARGQRVARALRSGTVWLNAHNKLFAEAETGGYRESGQGRLHGLEGLNDFLETKHIYSEAGWTPPA